MTYGSSNPLEHIRTAISQGAETLGEILTWGVDSITTTITYQTIQASLQKAGMSSSFARELCPRYAFSRACKELEESRIIRQISEDKRYIKFQFTKEALNQQTELLEYSLECTLTLSKKTGQIMCNDAAIADVARKLVKQKQEERTASDVSNIVQRMFAKHADLFPVREKGGCYFVPKMHLEFVEKVETFLLALGGHINRFPILAGAARGNVSVKNVVTAGLISMVEDHRKAIQRLGSSTQDSTFNTRYEAIEATRLKAECYAEFLKDQAEQVFDALELAKQELTEAKTRFIDAALAS